jgi:hypothetical protein
MSPASLASMATCSLESSVAAVFIKSACTLMSSILSFDSFATVWVSSMSCAWWRACHQLLVLLRHLLELLGEHLGRGLLVVRRADFGRQHFAKPLGNGLPVGDVHGRDEEVPGNDCEMAGFVFTSSSSVAAASWRRDW